MTPENNAPNSSTEKAQVDQQDGGPASHTENNSGGQHDDVASGGTSDGDSAGSDEDTSDSSIEHDVHGDPDTVS